MDTDTVIFSSLILLHVALVAWVHKARPPVSILDKYPTGSVLLSWIITPSLNQAEEPPPEEKYLLLRYKRRVIIQFWCILFTVIFMVAYVYYSVGHIQS